MPRTIPQDSCFEGMRTLTYMANSLSGKSSDGRFGLLDKGKIMRSILVFIIGLVLLVPTAAFAQEATVQLTVSLSFNGAVDEIAWQEVFDQALVEFNSQVENLTLVSESYNKADVHVIVYDQQNYVNWSGCSHTSSTVGCGSRELARARTDGSCSTLVGYARILDDTDASLHTMMHEMMHAFGVGAFELNHPNGGHSEQRGDLMYKSKNTTTTMSDQDLLWLEESLVGWNCNISSRLPTTLTPASTSHPTVQSLIPYNAVSIKATCRKLGNPWGVKVKEDGVHVSGIYVCAEPYAPYNSN